MRRHSGWIVFLLLVAALIGITALSLWQRERQYALNRQLVDALFHNETARALTLVQQGADPNTRYDEPRISVLSQLLWWFRKRQPLPPNESPTAFMLACGDGWKEIVNGIMYDRRNHYSLPLIREMLAHNADLHAHMRWGFTPLLGALHYEHADVVELLLQHGASVNEPDELKRSPLMWCATGRQSEMVNLLLAHGADVRATDLWGNTALHCAVQYNADKEIVGQLLDHGANPNQPNKAGVTPLKLAKLARHSETVALLGGK